MFMKNINRMNIQAITCKRKYKITYICAYIHKLSRFYKYMYMIIHITRTNIFLLYTFLNYLGYIWIGFKINEINM